MKALESKRAIVCGASQGIGLAIANKLAFMGANVTVLARQQDKLKAVVKDLPSQGQAHDYIAIDLGNTSELDDALSSYKQKHHVDIIVNNAGGPPPGPAHQASLDAYLEAFKLHLLSAQLMVQHFVPNMKLNQFGRIVNIISTSVKQPIKGLGVSNTIRGAVANWAKTLASELGEYGITVNNVLPGATQTARLEAIIEGKSVKQNCSVDDVIAQELSLIPAGRFGEPQELASAVGFLVSNEAAYITGVNLPVDGGRTTCL